VQSRLWVFTDYCKPLAQPHQPVKSSNARARIVDQDALARFRKIDDLVCYRLLDVVVEVSGPQADADLFERDT
jgi:hypothetical protein